MAVEDAERSHAKHSKFLNQTMEKSVFAVIQSYKIYHDMLHLKALLIFVLHFGLIINTIVPAYYSWIIFFYRLQKRHEDENKRYKEHMKNKMEMLLKLKGDITANRVFDHIHCICIFFLLYLH